MTRSLSFRGIAGSISDVFRRRRSSLNQEDMVVRDMDKIAAYHRSFPPATDTVGEQTWADLEMDAVFAKVDHAATILGRQVLYHQIHLYEGDDVLAERARQQDYFLKQEAHREFIRLQIKPLSKPQSNWLADLIMDPVMPRPRYAWALIPLSVTCLLFLLGILIYPPLLPLALLFILVNATIHVRCGQNITPYFQGFSQISTMLGVGQKLAETSAGDSLPQIESLRQAQSDSNRLRKNLGWLVFDRTRLPELVSSLIEYLNVFFLLDLIVFHRSLATLRKSKALLLKVFSAIGSLDASIAAATYWHSLPLATRPRISDGRELVVTEIYHPLVRKAVGGSVSLIHRSAVVAGPNMAGKTTFIRTIAINLILSRTLNICLARSAILPRATVHSSIKREDALLDGQSYFFAELDQILGFVKLAAEPQLRLFLIDEPFRGTNTVERIAASSSVLRHLAQHHIVLASTHDGELQELLRDSFDMFNFSDQVVEGKYGFDYIIRPGPAQSRNAIRLLGLRGYPASVTTEADRLATSLSPPKRPDSVNG